MVKSAGSSSARRSVGALARAALVWWLAELMSLVPSRLKPRQKRRSELEIHVGRSTWTVHLRGAQDIEIDPENAAAMVETLAAMRGRRKQAAAVLVFPLSRCFRRSTEVPRLMLGHARSILMSELEANTPFLAQTVHWDWFVHREGTEPGSVELTQIVLKRRDVDAAAQALAGAGISIAAIAVEDDSAPSPTRLPVDLQRYFRHDSDEASKYLSKARGVLIGAAVLTSVAIVPVAFFQQTSTIASLDADIADASDAVAAHPGMSRAQLKALGDAMEGKRSDPSSAEILDALATVLPPDTYLDHAYLDRDVLTIQGKTTSTRALERALSASPLFNVGHNTAEAATHGDLLPFTIRLKTRPGSTASGA